MEPNGGLEPPVIGSFNTHCLGGRIAVHNEAVTVVPLAG